LTVRRGKTDGPPHPVFFQGKSPNATYPNNTRKERIPSFKTYGGLGGIVNKIEQLSPSTRHNPQVHMVSYDLSLGHAGA